MQYDPITTLAGAQRLAGLLGEDAALVRLNGFGVRALPDRPASRDSESHLVVAAAYRNCRGALDVYPRDILRVFYEWDGQCLFVLTSGQSGGLM